MSFGAARVGGRAIRALRPYLALLLLLAGGTQALAAAQGPECARQHDVGQHPQAATAADLASAPLVGDGHHHAPDRSAPIDALAGTTCPPVAAIVRAVDPTPALEPSRLIAEHAAAPTTLRPGALFRPPRTI